jgi:hypothetical protein
LGQSQEWIDSLTPGAVPFIFNDVTEEKEWGGFTSELRGVARSVNVLLAKLNNSANPC